MLCHAACRHLLLLMLLLIADAADTLMMISLFFLSSRRMLSSLLISPLFIALMPLLFHFLPLLRASRFDVYLLLLPPFSLPAFADYTPCLMPLLLHYCHA